MTNELRPMYNNSAVRFFFYGGKKQQKNSNYTERLTCNSGLKPILLTLEASWGIFTSYSFNETTDAPFVDNGGIGSYYELDPVALREIVIKEDSSAAGPPTITFKAEYKCECPAGYKRESGNFNNITSCTICPPGTMLKHVE